MCVSVACLYELCICNMLLDRSPILHHVLCKALIRSCIRIDAVKKHNPVIMLLLLLLLLLLLVMIMIKMIVFLFLIHPKTVI